MRGRPISTKNTYILFLIIFFSSISLEALPIKEILIGNESLMVEVAETPRELRRGLMDRTELEPGHGMLFIFKRADILSFWMKNTYIPLSIAFFNERRVLINVEDLHPWKGAPLPCVTSSAPALYALEVPQGWFAEHKIEPGMKFSFRHP